MNVIGKSIKHLLGLMGYDVVHYINHNDTDINPDLPHDFDAETISIIKAVKSYTMTSPERIFALVAAVKYVVEKEIDGDMVECGVWKGGSSMAMALALINAKDESRNLYLYDTFVGMSRPSDVDITLDGYAASDRYEKIKFDEESSDWCNSPLEEVKANLYSTGYPQDKLNFIQGMVEKTIPFTVPDKIAILRLDTDWYSSTKHELLHLFPLVSKYGVILIDDYGHWEGSKKAVDEYITDNKLCLYLNRIDYTARVIIKPF